MIENATQIGDSVQAAAAVDRALTVARDASDCDAGASDLETSSEMAPVGFTASVASAAGAADADLGGDARADIPEILTPIP